jgi:hypothetical protein
LKGVADAQDEISTLGGAINPVRFGNTSGVVGRGGGRSYKYSSLQDVTFDVAVTVQHEKSGGAKGKLAVMGHRGVGRG